MAGHAGETTATSSNSKTGKPTSSYNVNASSMLGLLSEVSKHTEGYKRGKHDSKNKPSSSSIITSKGGKAAGSLYSDRKGKKSSIFDRSNLGIEARSARDRTHMLAREDLSVEARRVLESRERLEKKAELYEKLARGENINGVSREQLKEGLLVDFETKALEESYKNRGPDTSEDDDDSEDDEDDDDDKDESKNVPRRHAERDDDELVETQDDFGRTRWVKRSTLAGKLTEDGEDISQRRSALEGGKPIFSEDISLASSSLPTETTYYGEQQHFHVYEPTAEEIALRRKALNLDEPLAKHFDSKKEIRTRGAGYMQFSADEETRLKQFEQLKNERNITELEREKKLKQGDIVTQRENEAQKRRALIEEKRRKILEKRKAVEEQREGDKKPKLG